MPTATLAQDLAVKYNLNADRITALLERHDADATKCGRGWQGTKPPGCARKKKGAVQSESTAKPSSDRKTRAATKPQSATSSSDNLETLRKTYKEKSWIQSGFSDVGNLQSLYADEIEHTSKPDRKLVNAFEKGERNYNPALVIETGKDQYKAIGDASQKAIVSAGEAKTGRVWAITVPNDPDQIKLAEMMQAHPDKTNPGHMAPEPVARKIGQGSKNSVFTDTGNYQHLYTDEMSNADKGKKHNATDEQIEAAAKLLLKTGGRNWVPVLVHENADRSYSVVGNHFAYAVAQKAGLERAWSVQVSSDRTDEPRKRRTQAKYDALDQLHEDAKWDKCGRGYAPPGTCKAGKPSGAVSGRHILTPHADPFSASGQKEQQGRSSRLNQLIEKLENGRFKPKADDPNAHGKQGALTALRDAKNPRIGLLTSHNKDGNLTGAMSYKEGRSIISVQNFGADGTTKGSGTEMFHQLLHHAAKLGKGIEASSVDTAKGFYTKMGMTDDGYGQFSMSKQEVAAAIAKISSRKDSIRTDATATEIAIYKLVAQDLQDAAGDRIRLREAKLSGKKVAGSFTSLGDGKTYTFSWDQGRIRFQPAVAKTDSMSDAEHSVAWLRHSVRVEGAAHPLTRVDSLALHTDAAKPKCGSGSYFCKASGSGSCIGVQKSCSNEGQKVNKERLNKINGLIDHLSKGGEHPGKGLDKPDAAKLSAVKASIQETRSLRAENLLAKRAGDRMAKAQPKEELGESLGQLFLEADRVGSKYQSPEEAKAYQRKLNEAIAQFGDEVDKQFPDGGGSSANYGKTQPQAQRTKVTGPGKSYLPGSVGKLLQPKTATTAKTQPQVATILDNPEAERARRAVMGIDKVPAPLKTTAVAARSAVMPTGNVLPSERSQMVSAGLPRTGTTPDRLVQGGTFTHPQTGVLTYRHKSPTDAELKTLEADGSLDFYKKQATKFGIKHKGDRDLVARVEAWRSKTQSPDIQAKRQGVSSQDRLKAVAEEINALPANAFATPPETASQQGKKRSTTAGDDPNYRGRYRHVSIDSLSHEAFTAASTKLIAQFPHLASRLDAAECGCGECKVKRKSKKSRMMSTV